MVEEGTIPSEEVSLLVDSLARKAIQVHVFIILPIFLHDHLSSYRSRVSEWFRRNGKFVQFLEFVYRRQE